MFVILKYYISAFYICSDMKILYNIVRNVVTNTKIYHVESSSCYYNSFRFSDIGKCLRSCGDSPGNDCMHLPDVILHQP